jgi:NAD-dependent SIR2 family protein deacetylase
MNELDSWLGLTRGLDLHGEYCQLDHSGAPPGYEKVQAVNWFMQPMIDGGRIEIPICKYCADELQKGENFEWYLLICKCGETHWIPRSSPRVDYKEQVNFVKSCPRCSYVMKPRVVA